MSQPDLFETSPRFDGPCYEPDRDQARLLGQRDRILKLLQDGRERSLRDIAQATGDGEASISAQLRHLQRPPHGGHNIQKRHVSNGLWVYWLVR